MNFCKSLLFFYLFFAISIYPMQSNNQQKSTMDKQQLDKLQQLEKLAIVLAEQTDTLKKTIETQKDLIDKQENEHANLINKLKKHADKLEKTTERVVYRVPCEKKESWEEIFFGGWNKYPWS